MANNLHISYDLRRPDRNYDQVIQRIEGLGSWAKLEYSFFFVSSGYSALEAFNHVWAVMHSGDKLYVVDAKNNDAAWQGMPDEVDTAIQQWWTH